MREAVSLPADQSMHDIKWQSGDCSLFPPAERKAEYQIDAQKMVTTIILSSQQLELVNVAYHNYSLWGIQ